MPTDSSHRLANHDPGVQYNELKKYRHPRVSVRPSASTILMFSIVTAGSIKAKCHVEHSNRKGEPKFL